LQCAPWLQVLVPAQAGASAAVHVPGVESAKHAAWVRTVAVEQEPVTHLHPRTVASSQVASVVNAVAQLVSSASDTLATAAVATQVAAEADAAGTAAVKVHSAGQLAAVGAVPRRCAQVWVPLQWSQACVPEHFSDPVATAVQVQPVTVHASEDEKPAQEDVVASPAQDSACAFTSATAAAKVQPVGQLSVVGADHEHPFTAEHGASAVKPSQPAVVGVPAHVAGTLAAALTASVAAVKVQPFGHSVSSAALATPVSGWAVTVFVTSLPRQSPFCQVPRAVPSVGTLVHTLSEVPAATRVPSVACLHTPHDDWAVAFASTLPSALMQSPAREHVAVPTQAPADQVPAGSLAVHSAAFVLLTVQVWATWFQVPEAVVHAAKVAAARVQLSAIHKQPRGARLLFV